MHPNGESYDVAMMVLQGDMHGKVGMRVPAEYSVSGKVMSVQCIHTRDM